MTRSSRVLLASLLLIGTATVGAGCLATQQGGDSGAAEEYTLDGKVLDARTGDPVADVRIEVEDRSATTGSDGGFEVGGLEGGSYTVVANRSGYFPTRTNVTVGFDNKVWITLRSEEYYSPERSELLGTHWTQGVTCERCHGASTVETIQAPPTNRTCIECHPLGQLQNRTAEFDPNPHRDPHDLFRNCMNCHRVHGPSVKPCTECHSGEIIPDAP